MNAQLDSRLLGRFAGADRWPIYRSLVVRSRIDRPSGWRRSIQLHLVRAAVTVALERGLPRLKGR